MILVLLGQGPHFEKQGLKDVTQQAIRILRPSFPEEWGMASGG